VFVLSARVSIEQENKPLAVNQRKKLVVHCFQSATQPTYTHSASLVFMTVVLHAWIYEKKQPQILLRHKETHTRVVALVTAVLRSKWEEEIAEWHK
jgi:hypothetical protein